MLGAVGGECRGHRDVDLFAGVFVFEFCLFQFFLARGKGLFRPFARAVDHLAHFGALFRRQIAHALQERGDLARLAQKFHLQFKERFSEADGREPLFDLLSDLLDFFFHNISSDIKKPRD